MTEATREPVFFSCDPDQEHLRHTEPDEAIEAHLDDLEAMPETVTVHGFARMPVKKERTERLAADHLELLLETLDEELGDPEFRTKPTEVMTAHARRFVTSVVEEYEVWACEKISEETVNSQQWAARYRPDWIEALSSPEVTATSPELPPPVVDTRRKDLTPEGPHSGVKPSDPPEAITGDSSMGSMLAVASGEES